MYEIEFYVTPQGRNPYQDWILQLRDKSARNAVVRRMARMEQGNFGDCNFCQGGVWELRIHLGPGYRIYYGLSGTRLVVVLCAGDKTSQTTDIRLAAAYWKQYQEKV